MSNNCLNHCVCFIHSPVNCCNFQNERGTMHDNVRFVAIKPQTHQVSATTNHIILVMWMIFYLVHLQSVNVYDATC